MGDGYSLAWRVLDAQYWGVPQRRRRIFLVADFGGRCAGKILFEREGLHGDIAASREAREEDAAGVENSTVVSVWPIRIGALRARADSSPCVDNGQPFVCVKKNALTAVPKGFGETGQGYWQEGIGCLRAEGESRPIRPSNVILLFENHGQDSRLTGPLDISPVVSRKFGTGGNNTPIVCTMQGFGDYKETGAASSLQSRDYKDATDFAINDYHVRRLTPKECERLQGFPDGWTECGHDGKSLSDSARYKALGNSVAIPCVEFILRGISEQGRR